MLVYIERTNKIFKEKLFGNVRSRKKERKTDKDFFFLILKKKKHFWWKIQWRSQGRIKNKDKKGKKMRKNRKT